LASLFIIDSSKELFSAAGPAIGRTSSRRAFHPNIPRKEGVFGARGPAPTLTDAEQTRESVEFRQVPCMERSGDEVARAASRHRCALISRDILDSNALLVILTNHSVAPGKQDISRHRAMG